MKLFTFEASIPSWSSQASLLDGILQWKDAGISTVMLQVDDGNGATWSSTIAPIDVRVSSNPTALKDAIYTIREHGISVILVFCVIGIVRTPNPLKSEYLSPSGDYYDLWNEEFFQWRKNYILECLSLHAADGVALDYIRTGRPASQGQIPADEIVEKFLLHLRLEMPAHLSLMNISHTVYNNPNSQGVNFLNWYNKNLIDYLCVYNYSNQFPFKDIENLPKNRLWVLTSNYSLINNVAVKKGYREYENQVRSIQQSVKPLYFGSYLARQAQTESLAVFKHLPLNHERR